MPDEVVVGKTPETASVGDRVLIAARPKSYIAEIVYDSYGRLGVRPLPDQGVTRRARAVWRTSVLEVLT